MVTVLYLTDDGFTSYNSENSKNTAFTWHQLEEIDRYLALIPEQSEVSLVFDVMDEDLYFEWLPKVFFWEKKSIQNRKKEWLQGNHVVLAKAKWTSATRVSGDGRKEALFFSVTINKAPHIKNFMSSLEEAQIMLTAIYSKPFLLAEYFKKKVIPFFKINKLNAQNPCLITVRGSKYTFRQVFFINGELRLSRLVEMDSADVEIVKRAIIRESKLALTYVYDQKLTAFNCPISFIFLDADSTVLEGLEVRSKDEKLFRSSWKEADYFFETSVFNKITQNGVNCKPNCSEYHSMQAIVDFILQTRPTGFYSTPSLQKINNLLIGRRLLMMVNILLFLGGFYYVLISGIDTAISWQKQKLLVENITKHEIEVARLESMAKLQDNAQFIKASVEFSESILKLKVGRLMGFNISELSRVLTENSNIQLSKIDWKTLGEFDSRKNQIIISAWVFPFHGTYKQPVFFVDKFIKGLKGIKGIIDVNLQKSPLNRVSSQMLTINSSKGDVKALPLTVTLRVQDVQSK